MDDDGPPNKLFVYISWSHPLFFPLLSVPVIISSRSFVQRHNRHFLNTEPKYIAWSDEMDRSCFQFHRHFFFSSFYIGPISFSPRVVDRISSQSAFCHWIDCIATRDGWPTGLARAFWSHFPSRLSQHSFIKPGALKGSHSFDSLPAAYLLHWENFIRHWGPPPHSNRSTPPPLCTATNCCVRRRRRRRSSSDGNAIDWVWRPQLESNWTHRRRRLDPELLTLEATRDGEWVAYCYSHRRV